MATIANFTDASSPAPSSRRPRRSAPAEMPSGPGGAGQPRCRDAARPGSVTARGGNLSYRLAGGPAILAGRADGRRGDGCRDDGRGHLDATPGKMDPAKLPSVWRNRFRFRYRPKCRARPTSGPLSIDQVQGLDVATMPARVHVFTTRRGSPRFTIRPVVDRPGAGPRRGHHAGTCSRVHNAAGISTLHHPARCRSTGCRASTWPPCRHVFTCSQRGGDLHASPSAPPSIDQVQGLDVATMPARVHNAAGISTLHHPARRRSTRCRASTWPPCRHVFTTRRGSPRFTIRPAVDRPGAEPRRGHHAGTCSRVHNAAGNSTLHHPPRCRSTRCRASTWPPCRHVFTCSQRGGDLHASPSAPLSIDQVHSKRRPRPWFDHAGSAGSSWNWPAHARRIQLETRGLSPMPGHPPRRL